MNKTICLALVLLAATPFGAKAATQQTIAKADLGMIPEGRLPDLARPLRYRVVLTVFPEKNQFSGHVEIDVALSTASKGLWINGRGLKVSRSFVRTPTGNVPAVYEQVDPLGVVRLDFARELKAGEATLVFDYQAPFSTSASALFHVKVGDDWYAWSQFESTDARGAFPGFDQPGYKTPFEVTLITHAGQITTSNAPETAARREGTLERHHFEPTRPLPTYLVQFGVGPFVVASGEVPPTPQRAKPLPLRIVATRPNAGKLQYALDETPRIVELLEKYFGQPFPFSKLDQIASPIMQGAMENAGADTYGDNILLLDPGASTQQRQTFGMVVAHELAHQWFGDMVTPDWWSDIWLNESFANWMGYRIGNEWRPELNIGVGAIDEGLAAMNTDSLVAGRPIHQTITRTGEIESAFDSVTYGKGGQVVAMIAAYLGDDRFREGVRLHLSRHPYGNATSEDFFSALSEAAHEPLILAAMKSFVDQQGVPLVTISRDASGKLRATQKRYALLGSSPPPTTWTIPLCMRVAATRSCSLLAEPAASLDVTAAGPLMPNAGGLGYYRFALDDADWQGLIATAATLPAGEALAATDSLWAAFWAGHLAPARLVEAARVMADNPDSNASVDGGQRLSGLRVRGMIPDSSMADYHRTMGSIYGPKLSALGADLRARAYANDPPDRQKMRAALIHLVSEEARDETLRGQMLESARRYLTGDMSALDQSTVGAALQVYVETTGLPASKAVLAKALDSHDQLFRSQALGALVTDRPEQVTWVLDTLQDPSLRQTEKIDLLGDLMANAHTRDEAYQYLTSHFDQLSKDAGIFSFGRVMSMPVFYCSVERAQDIETTLGAREQQYKRGSLELARTVERVRSCGLLAKSQGAELVDALRERDAHGHGS